MARGPLKASGTVRGPTWRTSSGGFYCGLLSPTSVNGGVPGAPIAAQSKPNQDRPEGEYSKSLHRSCPLRRAHGAHSCGTRARPLAQRALRILMIERGGSETPSDESGWVFWIMGLRREESGGPNAAVLETALEPTSSKVGQARRGVATSATASWPLV